ncbi:hypothetical protein DWB58_28925 [candidate division KSB1 bacterium]|nr:hypothetical protein [candidate division KSB1 bacterium]
MYPSRLEPASIDETKEFFGDYQGTLYDRMRKNSDALLLFKEIEPSFKRRDWEGVKHLLGQIARCLDVQTVQHPQMPIDFIEKIITYPLREIRTDVRNLVDEVRARWGFVKLLQATLISPGHWLLERELIAILLGSKYDLILKGKKFSHIEPHSSSIAKRTQYCPDYPYFARLSRGGRRGMAFAIHCNFKGNVVSGVCLREYLHDEYEAAVEECINAGFLSRDLELRDYLDFLKSEVLKDILRKRGIKPVNSKTQLIEVVKQRVPVQELEQYLAHIPRPSDLRMLSQVTQLRKILTSEKDRLSALLVTLEQSWGLLPSDKDFELGVATIASTQARGSYDLERPVLKFKRSTLEMISSLSIWQTFWDTECDKIVKELASELGWNAFFESAQRVIEHWGFAKTARFEADTQQLTPVKLGILGSEGAYNSTLELRCEARRLEMGITGPTPSDRICHNCKRKFSEASIPPKLAWLAGYYLGFCRDCLAIAFYRTGRGTSTKDFIDSLRSLCASLGQIPNAQYIRQPKLERKLGAEKSKRVIQALIELPEYEEYVEEFGSWFKALIAAGVLADNAMLMERGYRSVADDGHECSSLAELTIDNWLWNKGIVHEREPYYPFHPQLNPNERLRADWLVDNYYIEYFGMMEDADYFSKTEKKLELAQATNIKLVSLFPKDVASLDEALAVLIEHSKL